MLYEEDDKFHIFKVYDSGVSIKDTSALFEAFKSTKEKGNGLGLVLSQEIAHAHGGEVLFTQNDKKCFIIKLGKI